MCYVVMLLYFICGYIIYVIRGYSLLHYVIRAYAAFCYRLFYSTSSGG